MLFIRNEISRATFYFLRNNTRQPFLVAGNILLTMRKMAPTNSFFPLFTRRTYYGSIPDHEALERIRNACDGVAHDDGGLSSSLLTQMMGVSMFNDRR
jgi:hypothetical protein